MTTNNSNFAETACVQTTKAHIAKAYTVPCKRVNLIAAINKVLLISLICASIAQPSFAQDNLLVNDYPERYTVVKGDTLWDIAAKFLTDPWRWQEIWQRSPQVQDPDLIYPGDVLVLTLVDNQPVLRTLRNESLNEGGAPQNTRTTTSNRSPTELETVELSPSIYSQNFNEAIPAVDPRAIQAYINSPLVTDERELATAPYIVEGISSRLILGKYDQFYVRGLVEENAVEYRVFRPGRHFVDPVSRENLGWEAVHVGDANLLKSGDPARMSLLRTYTDVGVRDRLRPVFKKQALPFFYPKAPNNKNLRGVILESPNRATELGSLSVIAINLGERDQVQKGDVFRILSQRRKRRDPITSKQYLLPEEKIGLAMVFRTFEKVSYALVTNSSRSIRAGAAVASPEL